MPRCKICSELFVGGNPKDDENICMYCYIKKYVHNIIKGHKSKK